MARLMAKKAINPACRPVRGLRADHKDDHERQPADGRGSVAAGRWLKCQKLLASRWFG